MITASVLTTPEQTGREMRRLAETYSRDLAHFRKNGTPLNELPLPDFFRTIADIPYQKDVSGIEIVTRPYLVLSGHREADCKKKAILIAAYLSSHGIPYRFKAVSSRRTRELHHVLVEALIGNVWKEIDATYPTNTLFQPTRWTSAKLLSGNTVSTSSNPILVSLSGAGLPGPMMTYQYSACSDRIRSLPGLGDGGVSAVISIVTAIIAAVTSATVGIVSAVSNKRSQERAAESQRLQNEFSLRVYEKQMADQATLDQAEVIRQSELTKKLLTYGAIALTGFGLFKLA